MKPGKLAILIFLILSFITGIYFTATHKLEGFENKPTNGLSGPIKMDCPDVLIKSGNTILLYNSKMPEEAGVNPLPFYNLDEYINYLEIQRKNGIHCPVLFLQEEINTQGNSVFRLRPDIFNPVAGLPTTTELERTPVSYVDSSDDNPPYNSGMYNGFDPIGLPIGQYTAIDSIHDSTRKDKTLSENPMDSNWGGVLYTKDAVDSGKYKENEVYPAARSLYSEKSDNVRDLNSKKNIFS